MNKQLIKLPSGHTIIRHMPEIKAPEPERLSYDGLNPMLAKELSYAEADLAILYQENLKLKNQIDLLQKLIDNNKEK